MHQFKNLIVWQKARALVKHVYQITTLFLTNEKFGLISQMRRASVSIPSNIAEGAGRNSNKDFSRFLDIANGSSFELETQFYLRLDLEYISVEQFNSLDEKIQEIQKMLFSLKSKY